MKKTILFQGDSITDCGRRRDDPVDLAKGYPFVVAQRLPDVRVLNRGVSGNRVVDLMGRWQEDCLDLSPDIVSILVGVNDTWRRYDSNSPTSVEDFENNYRKLLTPLEEKGTKILLILPFLLDINDNVKRMREDLSEKQDAVYRLVLEFRAEFLDTEKIFQDALAGGLTPSEIAADGVHPTPKGHEILGEAAVKELNKIL